MAIDLPPVMPPALTPEPRMVSYQSSAGATYKTKIGEKQLSLTGDYYLSADELNNIFASVKTLSDGIILLNAAIASKGHYLVSIYYTPTSNGALVHAVQKKVGNIEGEGVSQYFESLSGDKDLKRWEYDRARVMANLKSERIGVDYSISLTQSPSDESAVDISFKPTPQTDADRTDLILQFGNQGSRYVGRYFADAGISHDFTSGTNLTLAYQTAIEQLGDTGDGEDYQQYSASLNHPFSSGLYGVQLSHAEYKQELDPIQVAGCTLADPILGICLIPGPSTTLNINLEADINRVALSGEHVLSSDLDRRTLLIEKLEYIDSTIDTNLGTALQEEKYATLEIGAKHNKASRFGKNKILRWNLTGLVKGGITGDDGTLGTQNTNVVSIGNRTAEFLMVKPEASARLEFGKPNSIGLSVKSQIADSQLPQQQQWVLGGIETLSAFLPGALSGDTGYIAKIDYTYATKLLGLNVAFSAFAEQGGSQFEEVDGTDGDLKKVSDAGLSIVGTMKKDLELKLVAARAIDDGDIDEQRLDDLEADFYFRIKVVF